MVTKHSKPASSTLTASSSGNQAGGKKKPDRYVCRHIDSRGSDPDFAVPRPSCNRRPAFVTARFSERLSIYLTTITAAAFRKHYYAKGEVLVTGSQSP
jgi:hypothetical protein